MPPTEISDNPVYLARVAAGYSRLGLAKHLEIARSTLIALEDGRTVEPKPETLAAIALATHTHSEVLRTNLAQWHRDRAQTVRARMPVEAQMILRYTPDQVRETFSSFADWREHVAGSAVEFARILGLNHGAVNAYESGIRTRGMPETLQGAILNRLGVPVPYLQALAALPPSTD